MIANAPVLPYVDIAQQHLSIKSELMKAISAVLDHGQFILGEELEKFEGQFAKLCSTRFAVGVNSGTDALVLALRVLGVGPGDEVITVPNSFIGSVACIKLVGAKPVFVDVGEDYNMDPNQLERAITTKTKAILPVHLTGRPADMKSICAIADEYNLIVVEDCAQAVMAEYRSRRVGSFGDCSCFSLHPLKTLSACGDSGIIVTDNEEHYEQLLILRNMGLKSRDDCFYWSSNSRLDSIQAAILLVKMKYLHEWTEKRRKHAAFYRESLKDLTEIEVPDELPYEKAVYHTLMIQTTRRDALKAYLDMNGIGTSIHYPVPIHLQRVAVNLGYEAGSFPAAERQAKEILSLPVYHNLIPENLDRIVQMIKQFYKQ
jgi:dTDP-4-amino-4,6-dideoxygalactose transaminase